MMGSLSSGSFLVIRSEKVIKSEAIPFGNIFDIQIIQITNDKKNSDSNYWS